MRRDSWLLGSLSALFLLLALTLPYGNWYIMQYLRGGSDDKDLAGVEIQALRNELALLENVRAELPSLPPDTVPARVYSRYPFNLKNELLLGAGSREGIREGQTVLVPLNAATGTLRTRGVLIGKVENVYKETSVVRTIFDERWQSAVRIGPAGVDALLKGGTEPKLTFIPKEGGIEVNDSVYNAAPGIPYGIAVGSVGVVEPAPDQVFREARLKVPYDLNRLQFVIVRK